MKPYYEDSAVTIYHGDSREILPTLRADAVVTDPPYGIGADRRQGERADKRHGAAAAPSRDYGPVSDWDTAPPSGDDFARILSVGKHHIVWGGNYFALPPASGWLVWDKETGANGYADCELAWTDLPMAVRRYRFQWMGMLQQIPEHRWHPTQKPLSVMRWAVGFLPESARVVVDPYMGSGTTLRAAKDLGRCAIGIEAEERYCEIAASRMAQEVLDLAA
jgi:site-specific DNA-methyltransferase (adenine-specific)